MTTRRFELHRDVDDTGVSGTGVVAEGVHFVEPDIAVLRWNSATPTSVVFHERGVASVEAVHGHGGHTRIVWLDDPVVCSCRRHFVTPGRPCNLVEVFGKWCEQCGERRYPHCSHVGEAETAGPARGEFRILVSVPVVDHDFTPGQNDPDRCAVCGGDHRQRVTWGSWNAARQNPTKGPSE